MPKYDRNTKTIRNKHLADYAKNHPELSWRELGVIFGVSGARAWLIAKREWAKEKA